MQSGPCESKLLMVKNTFVIVFSMFMYLAELKIQISLKKERSGFQN
jgi:hypothetical protein